jgi:hypothetical protein
LFGNLRYLFKEKVIGFLETEAADQAEHSLLEGDLNRAVHYANKLSNLRQAKLSAWLSSAEARLEKE